MGRWALVAVAPVELIVVGLLIAGVDVPVPLQVSVGALVAAVLLYELARWLRTHRRHLSTGAEWRAAAVAAAVDLLPTPVRTALHWEWRVWTGLIRGLFRRPDIPPGATAFTHHRALAPVRWTLVGLLVVEVVVVHLLVPAGALRLVLLLVGLYGLIWLTGFLLGSGPVRPHLVDGRRVVLRRGLTIDVVVPLDAIARVSAVRHNRTGAATVQVDDRTLSLVDNGGTCIEITLGAPLLVTLPRRTVEIDTVRAWVDEPRVMAMEIDRAIRRRPYLNL